MDRTGVEDSLWTTSTTQEGATEAGGRTTHLLWGEIGIRAVRDHGRQTPVPALWSETVSSQDRSHLRNEGGLQVRYGSPEVLGGMHALPNLHAALRTRRRAALRVVEEKAQVRVERGACGVGPEIERGDYRGIGSTKSGLR